MKTKRIKDKKAIAQARKPYCEWCGAHRDGGAVLEVHHIAPSRGMGMKSDDVPENLITLCVVCHGKAQRYEIKADDLTRKREENKKIFREMSDLLGIPIEGE